jgi:hypothetical protein
MNNRISQIISNYANRDVQSIDRQKDLLSKSYIKNYKFLLSFFQSNVLNEEKLVQGAHMVYGWMPKILNTEKKPQAINTVLNAIEQLGKQKDINSQHIEIVRNFTNNSLVGCSKLLHFKFPDKFAIWDSNVCSKLIDGNLEYQVQKTENYLVYRTKLEENKNRPECLAFAAKFKIDFKYSITSLRAIELMIFLSIPSK